MLRTTLLLPAREDRVTKNLTARVGWLSGTFRVRRKWWFALASRLRPRIALVDGEVLLGAGPAFLAREGAPRKARPKKMAAPKSGQVQGGNAQEGRRQLNAALQQYALMGPGPQDKS